MTSLLVLTGFACASLMSGATSPKLSPAGGCATSASALEVGMTPEARLLVAHGDLSACGEGLLTVDRGVVQVAIQLGQPIVRNTYETAYQVFRFVPGVPEDFDWLPSGLAGEFCIEYGLVDAGRATVRLDHVDLFSFTTERLYLTGEGNVLTDATSAHIFNGSELSVSSFSTEGATGLALEGREGEAAPSTSSILQSLADFGRDGGLANPCTDCNAGGPGSTSCEVTGCEGSPTGCLVTCGSGKFSCCKCTGSHSGALCSCCDAKPTDPPP
jgi:hypothetical protein